MRNYSFLGVSAIFWLTILQNNVAAFAPNSRPSTLTTSTSSSSSLHAMPPLIIGPMIRKMREEQAKKNIPLRSEEEAEYEAPGLRVGVSAWKWPQVWPYDSKMFVTIADEQQASQASLAGMASMMGGGMASDPAAMAPKVDESKKFKPIEYWSEKVADVDTEMDPDAAENLKNHFGFYLRDGMSVLELGAAENSYIPDGLKFSRHVGVGASQKLMDKNPALTSSLVVDLNKVEENRDVDSDELRSLASEPFDAVIMTNTVDYLTSPREVFRSCWHLLKPGGILMVTFSNKDAFSDKFGTAQTKAWTGYNDDQHMWMIGSFFQFSAGNGWVGLKGFDISPESAKKMDSGGPLSIMQKGKSNNLYVVQANKNYEDDSIDEADPEKSFRSKMWMLPVMESRDKELVAPRLRRAYEVARDDQERQALANNIATLPKIYECLVKMDQFAFTFQMQSQLAVDLVADPDFVGNDEQIMALKQGLGLRTPSPEFWAPVGQYTSAMDVESKINLLSHIVPRFGSGNPAQEAALEAFVSGMKPTFEVIRSKCPDMSEADVQLLGSELLAAEILFPGRSTKEEFAAWVGAMSETEMKTLLEERAAFKKVATEELQEYKATVAAEKERRESEKKLMEEQVQKAREERTMVFNPRTGKIEPKPKK